MDSIQLMYYARIQALTAVMEGMKAENHSRIQAGHSLAYSEDDFYGLQMDFERIAESIGNL